jgi:Delta24(24(1))-sterol reductase
MESGAASFCLVVASHAVVFGLAAPIVDPTAMSRSPFDARGPLLCFYTVQIVLARFAPGVTVRANGLSYRCNAYSSLWATALLAAAASVQGWLDLAFVCSMYPSLLVCSAIVGNAVALVVGLVPQRFDAAPTSSIAPLSAASLVNGRCLHPRCWGVDVKMVCEVRLSWTLLGFVSVGCLLAAIRTDGVGGGAVPSLSIVSLAHLLYVNACAKGEHYIPFTWDITTERFGWLLSFWNLCGVPLVYAHPALLIATNARSMPRHSSAWYALLSCVLLLAYWQWDVANADKNEFRAREKGSVPPRALFPTFAPLRPAPQCLRLRSGRTLLLEGMWGRARKFHYTMDMAMALVVALAASDAGPTAWAHFAFIVPMLVHRAFRDERECRRKYGAEWDVYVRAVPYRFVPGLW